MRDRDMTQPPRVTRASLAAQTVKNPPARQELQETQVRPLGGEDPLEQGMTSQSSILA